MLVYFTALLDGDSGVQAATTEDESEILNGIVGLSGNSQERQKQLLKASEPAEVERDSSPDVPLRISSRSKSHEAAHSVVTVPSKKRKRIVPKTTVTFPGLVNRNLSTGQPADDFGREFCILEGCSQRRKSSGVMLACGNAKCSTEWFHPECVNLGHLRGGDLDDLDWKCLNCRSTPFVMVAGAAGAGDVPRAERVGSTDELLASIRSYAEGHREADELVDAGPDVESGVSLFMSPSSPGDVPMGDDAVHRPSTSTAQSASQNIFAEALDQARSAAERSSMTSSSDDSFIEATQSSLAADLPQPADLPMADTEDGGPTSAGQSASQGLFAGTFAADRSPASAIHASSDDNFIEAMRSSLAAQQPRNATPIDLVLAGLSSNLRSDTAPASTTVPHGLPHDPMDTEPSDALFQALVTPEPQSEHEQYQQQLRDQMAQMAWRSSSTGVRRAMDNINRLGNPPPSQSPALRDRGTVSRQDVPASRTISSGPVLGSTEPSHQHASTTAAQYHHYLCQTSNQYQPLQQLRSGSLHLQPALQPISTIPSTHPRQQSLDMPPPPTPRRSTSFSPRSSLAVSRDRVGSTAMHPPAQRYVFAAVTPLPLSQWVLPTPETTFRAGVSAQGECDAWERARIEHYLKLTGGLGGLPTLEPF